MAPGRTLIVQGASSVLTPSGAPPSCTGIALAQDAINWRYLQELCFGILQEAGFSSIPSLKTIPSTTSASSGEPFNDRQPSDTLVIRSKTIARHAARLPFPLRLVSTRARSGQVATIL